MRYLRGMNVDTFQLAEITVTRARPEAGTHPAVVVFPSIFGVTDELRAHLAAFADAGAVACAFDPFARGDAGPLPFSEMPRALARLGGFDFSRAAADFAEVIAVARADDRCNGKVVALGICLGGAFTWLAAADGAVDAAATWHGSRMASFLDRARDIRCPLSLHFGDADPLVPMADVQRIRDAFAGRPDVAISVYPGAGHGFSQPGAPQHDPVAERGAVAGVRALLAELRS